MDFGRTLVRVHCTKVHQLVPVMVLDQPPLNPRETPRILGENSLLIGSVHPADLTHDTAAFRTRAVHICRSAPP